jgi:hypothetical protein
MARRCSTRRSGLPGDSTEGRAAIGVQDETGVDGKILHEARRELLGVVQLVHLLAGEGDVCLAGPAGVDCELGAVLLRRKPYGCRLDAQRQVLGDDRDIQAITGEVERDGEDA